MSFDKRAYQREWMRTKRATSSELVRKRQTASNRLRRAKAKELGLCGTCARQPVKDGCATCHECLERHAARKRRERLMTSPSSYLDCCQAFGRHRLDCKARRSA